MNEPAREGGALLLVGWIRSPNKRAARLFEILALTRDDELELLMTVVGGRSGCIAWAEYGRRRFGYEFGIQNGSVVPEFRAKAPRDAMSS